MFCSFSLDKKKKKVASVYDLKKLKIKIKSWLVFGLFVVVLLVCLFI